MSEKAPIETIFEKLITVSEIFSEVLSYLTFKDRLNLRECSVAVEKAVAESDLLLSGSFDIEEDSAHLTLCLSGLPLKIAKEYHELSDLIRLRRRLFARVHVNVVKIKHINFNTVPVDGVKNLLRGVVFARLSMRFKPGNYHPDITEFLREHTSKCVELTFNGLSSDNLLSIGAVDYMRINKRNAEERSLDEQAFIELVKRRHAIMKIRVALAFTSGQAIMDAVQLVAESNRDQEVIVDVPKRNIEQFLLLTGFRMINDDIVRERDSEFVIELEQFEDGDEWTKDFWLHDGMISVYAYYLESPSPTYRITIKKKEKYVGKGFDD